jgi:hypothetical protein
MAQQEQERYKLLTPQAYLAMQQQARLLAAMETELFLADKLANKDKHEINEKDKNSTPTLQERESVNQASMEALNKLYREFVTEDSNKWKTFRSRSSEILMSSLALYFLHFPKPIKEVNLLGNRLRNTHNDPALTEIKKDIELNGPTPENMQRLKAQLGAIPEIERAINYALKAFKIFVVGTVLYYLILNGGFDDIYSAFALTQSFDSDEIEKLTEENFNTTTWIDINEGAWMEYVRSQENRNPTPEEIENHRKRFEN